jgi:hypothetical protein
VRELVADDLLRSPKSILITDVSQYPSIALNKGKLKEGFFKSA